MNADQTQKTETIFLGVAGALLVIWRWFLDATETDYINIGQIVIPDWWWNFALLLLITIVCFSEIKRRGATRLWEKLIGSKFWFVGMFVIASGFLILCNRNSCSSAVIELSRNITLTFSLLQLLTIMWLVYRRK